MTTAAKNDLVPAEVMQSLEAARFEMRHLSEGLAQVERELSAKDGMQDQYTAFVDAYEIGLWEQHVEGAKLPAKDLRLKLAHRAMPPELYGRYFALVKSRDRMLERISTLKYEINALRGILDALKAGLV